MSPPVPRQCWVTSPAAPGEQGGAWGGVWGSLGSAGHKQRQEEGLWTVTPGGLWKARSYCRSHQQQSPGEGRGGGSAGGEAVMAAELISPSAAAKVMSQS